MWKAEEWLPKQVQGLISGTSECVILYDKKDFVGVIKVMDFKIRRSS